MKLTFEQRARQARTANVPPASDSPRIPEATGQGDHAAPSLTNQQEPVPPALLPTHGASFLTTQAPDLVHQTLESLTEKELLGLPYLFDFWAHPHQLPPPGDWRTWVILGGRGAGKTRAGAEWVRSMVEGPRPHAPGKAKRVALLAETIDQAREVMVFGDSGLLACSPSDRRPHWHATRRMLEWPNGAVAQLFSAHEPEALRGPQFDCAWADELAKWKKAEEAWDMLQFGLRLGNDPRCVVTTTPRSSPLLLDLLNRPGTVQTHGKTRSNRAFLARSFMEDIQARYGNTRLGKQELDGLILDDIEGALWSWDLIDAARAETVPVFDRVVVAVDPAVSMGKGSDSTGIVVVGAVTTGHVKDWHAWVLEDATVQGASPEQWGRAVVRAVRRHGASRVVAEVNQGGAMVESILRHIDPLIPVTTVHASTGKALRAEPVAALYEQGRVHHLRSADLSALEDQMTCMTVSGFEGRGSPDRLDALVWALHEAILAPSNHWTDPRVRSL